MGSVSKSGEHGRGPRIHCRKYRCRGGLSDLGAVSDRLTFFVDRPDSTGLSSAHANAANKRRLPYVGSGSKAGSGPLGMMGMPVRRRET